MPSTRTIEKGQSFTIPDTVPTWTGYNFAGWSYNTQTYQVGETIDAVSDNITLTAKWNKMQETVDVSFAAGDASTNVGHMPSTRTIEKNQNFTIPDTVPTWDGHTFAGWLYNGTTYQVDDTIPTVSADITLTAQWTSVTPPQPVNKIPVNFATGTSSNVGNMPANGEAEKGANYTLPSNHPTRNTGSYVFSGWKSSLDSKTYQPGATVTIPADATSVTFTAQWTKKYYPDYDEDDDRPSRPSKPTYDEYRIRATCSDGGWVSPAGSSYVREGRNLTVTFAPYKGYAIDGVYIDGVLDNRYDGSYTFRDVDENHTIYVRYVRDSGSSGGSSGGGSHWDDDTSPKTGDTSAPLSMGLGVGSLALIAFLVARKMRRA